MDVNTWAVVAAAVSSFLPGGLWYAPILCLKPWHAAMRRSEQNNGRLILDAWQ